LLDELFFKKGFEKHKIDYILFGFVITIIGILTSFIIFGVRSSNAQLLVITLLLVPAVMRLISKEENIIRKQGLKHIYSNHKDVFEIMIFIFIGVFIAFFFTQLVVMAKGVEFRDAYSFQTGLLDNHEYLSYGFDGESGSFGSTMLSLGVKLLIIVAATFALSFLYGSGGIFVVVAMATIFSTMLVYLIKSTIFLKFSVIYMVFILLMLIPIILTSIAGGIISKAFVHEKIRSRSFKEVIREGVFIFVVSLILTAVIAALWSFFLFVA